MDIVNALITKEMLYEDISGNLVFVGLDENNKPRFASLRGTNENNNYRADCKGSDKRYSFRMMAEKPKRSIYVFESPIGAISQASIKNIEAGNNQAWKHDNRLSLSGTSLIAMDFYLQTNKAIKELILCLDNDEAGRKATAAIIDKYTRQGYKVVDEPPKAKDYSEDLQVLRAQLREKKRSRTKSRGMEI